MSPLEQKTNCNPWLVHQSSRSVPPADNERPHVLAMVIEIKTTVNRGTVVAVFHGYKTFKSLIFQS